MDNPYAGFESSYYPSYNEAYDRCSCGQPNACGNEHKPAVKLVNVTRATRAGGQETVTVAAPLGQLHQNVAATRAFATWDAQLAMNDLKPPRVSKYYPPALPYICASRGDMSANMCSKDAFCSP